MTDYKNARYEPDPETPGAKIAATLALVGIFAVVLFAPTWTVWIEGVCK